MSKTMKKIGTILAAATMVGATLTGAIAADLSNYPAPFVSADGKADVTIVFGQSAATSDVIGAVDIAIALQTKAVTTSEVNMGGSKTQVATDGAKVESSGNGLLLNVGMSSLDSRFDDKDLPSLLASGVVSDDSDNKDYDYDQTLDLGTDVKVRFDADDSDMTEPVLYLDLDTSLDTLWNYTVDFKGKNLDMTKLEDSETIEMMGRVFTFDSAITATSDITLYGSKQSEFLTLAQPKTFTVGGKDYTVEITGGSEKNSEVTISVNGQAKTMAAHDTKTIGGIEIYAKDVIVENIPTLSASATLFVGSEKIVLHAADSTTAPTGQEVEIASESVNGLVAYAYGVNNTAVDKIVFEFQPSAMSGDVSGFDETNFLEVGKSVVDPLFGTFKVVFAGGNYALDDKDKAMFSLKNAGKEVELSATTNAGNTIVFKPFKIVSNESQSNLSSTWAVDGKGYNGVVAAAGYIAKNQIFLVQDTNSEPKTYAFEVLGFSSDNGVNQTRLKNLATGQVEKYGVGDKLVDGTSFDAVNNNDDDTFSLDAATVSAIYLDGGKQKLQLDTQMQSEATKTFTLQEADRDTATTALNLLNFTASVDTSDDDVQLAWTDSARSDATGYVLGDESDDSNTQFGLTQYGTYVVADIDNKDSVKVYTPKDKDGEVQYGVFFTPTDATVTTTGSSKVTTTKVNNMGVGSAVLDRDVTYATEAKNLIVVGGPCANTVAAALLKTTKESCAAGFVPGKAVIQLFATPMGKTAMLVAGYTATETQAASRAVALFDKRLTGQSVTLTATTATDYTIGSTQ